MFHLKYKLDANQQICWHLAGHVYSREFAPCTWHIRPQSRNMNQCCEGTIATPRLEVFFDAHCGNKFV